MEIGFWEYLLGTLICAAIWWFIIDEKIRLFFPLRLILIIFSLLFTESWVYIAYGIFYKFPSFVEALTNWIFIIVSFIFQWDLDSNFVYLELIENIIGILLSIPLFIGTYFVPFYMAALSDGDKDPLKKIDRIIDCSCMVVGTLELTGLLIYRFNFKTYIGLGEFELYEIILLDIIFIVLTCISLVYSYKYISKKT